MLNRFLRKRRDPSAKHAALRFEKDCQRKRGHLMKNVKRAVLLMVCTLLFAALGGCVEDARTGLVCPPGSHPGPHGHHCFAD